MRILYFGTFDPAYGRNRVMLQGFKDNSIEVISCNGGLTGGIKKFARLVWRYLKVSRQEFDLIVVPFPAQESMLVAALVLWFQRLYYRTPLIVDMLTSHYDGYILDRKKYSRWSSHALWYWCVDWLAIQLADCAIVDSDANGRFFSAEFHISANKFLPVLIGTDAQIMKPTVDKSASERLLVHFHGKFIPHQGIDTIIRAAHLLKNEAINFQIIGRGQGYAEYRAMADGFGLSNINWIDSVPYEQLPGYIGRADVCLGPMGGTGHFDRCAPNKIYEYMACGKPIIIGRSQALEGIAHDGVNMLLVNPTDEHDLAKKILLVGQDTAIRRRLGDQARADFLNCYTPQKIVVGFLENLKAHHVIQSSRDPRNISILITGAKGFIGSRLSIWLRDQGYRVRDYTEDINDKSALRNAAKDIDIIIHLAAKIDDTRSGREYDDFTTVNVAGTQQVIDVCREHGCALLFFSSAIAVRPTSLYGLSKALAEQLIRFYARHYGLRAHIIRPHNLYNNERVDRRGKQIGRASRAYPLASLLLDIEKIIAEDRFSTTVPISTTRLSWYQDIVYRLRTIVKYAKR